MDKQFKVALPKGRLLGETAALLDKAGWGLNEYNEKMRFYRLSSAMFPGLLAKVFHEKDIPIQVSVGNYDLGICGLDWVEELLGKYPNSNLVKLKNLAYGDGALYLLRSKSEAASTMEEIREKRGVIRIASEYPNLAEAFALKARLRRFSIFPLWGAAEAYPPDSADLALISGRPGEEPFKHELVAVDSILDFNACLIANKRSLEEKNLSPILASIDGQLTIENKHSSPVKFGVASATGVHRFAQANGDTVRWALPDGHQQPPTSQLLIKAGIQIDDYPSTNGNRRPASKLDGVVVKVIRPQDMPLQVANGNFDIAITGRDWLTDHLYQFPSSPVTELLDLKMGKVRLVAVVHNDLPVDNIPALRRLYAERAMPVRVASEYTNIADKCARDNHLGVYRVIPTWGATEAFLPEDADLLIENTETGRTIARNNLKIIETLFESTACVIGNKESIANANKGAKIKSIIKTLRAAVE